MEMEHINENLIKVLIGPEDLEERGIDFLDLIGDQSSIENFFYSILEEVDVHKHFEGSDAVTFQVMPNQDGLELYISRSNFDDMQEMDEIFEDELTKQLMNQKKRFLKERKLGLESKQSTTPQRETLDGGFKNLNGKIIRFQTLEDFISLAREIPSDLIQSSLYQLNQNYYLTITDVDPQIQEEGGYNRFLAMLEYGELHKISIDVLEEYGQLLHSGDTLKFFGTQF